MKIKTFLNAFSEESTPQDGVCFLSVLTVFTNRIPGTEINVKFVAEMLDNCWKALFIEYFLD